MDKFNSDVLRASSNNIHQILSDYAVQFIINSFPLISTVIVFNSGLLTTEIIYFETHLFMYVPEVSAFSKKLLIYQINSEY